MRRAVPIICAVTASVVIGAGGAVLAGASVRHRPAAFPRAAEAAGQASALCRFGFQTNDDVVGIPVNNLIAVATVMIAKPCAGRVAAHFSAETVLPRQDQIQVLPQARCVDDGGLADGCSAGQTIRGEPGVPVLDSGKHPVGETHAFTAIWPHLKRGSWRIEWLASGITGAARMGLRTLDVEAYGTAA